jgi:ketosteroid isomerase-like protein
MSEMQWVKDLFATIDHKDAEGFVGRLTEDATFVFGNAEPVTGRGPIHDLLVGFFSSIRGLRHRLEETWLLPDAAIVTGRVTYTRHDGSTLEVPFADVFKMHGRLVHDYLIYIDASKLYNP